MARLDGYLFSYPGLPSLTVPYHDTNDFFFSGHIGTCLLIALEYRARKQYNMFYFTCFIMINQWTMMTLTRSHFAIDMWAGLFIAHYMFRHAERISYIFDVKVLGIPSKKRGRLFFKPCKCCGWSNKYAADFMTKEEKLQLKSLYKVNM